MTSSPLPLRHWLIRRRRSTWLIAALAAATLLGVIVYRGRQPRDPLVELQRGTWRVMDVNGPLTLLIDSPNGPRAVRLLGLLTNTPEACAARLRECCANTRIRLSLDRDTTRDTTSSLPAYVYLADGRMLNEMLLREALAQYDPDAHHDLGAWFKRLTQRSPAGRG